MTGEYFVHLWPELRHLRLDIEELAQAFTKEPKHWKWLVRLAWAHIGEMPHDKTTHYYRARAYAIMRVKYERYIRDPSRGPAWSDPGVKRANRKMRKYQK